MKIKESTSRILIFSTIILLIVFIYSCFQEDHIIGKLPTESENHIKDALACFPVGTFKDININFVDMNSDHMTWATRPSVTSFFRPRKKRIYIVQKSTHQDMQWMYNQIPYKGQVGILVHELCHILDYENLSKTDIIDFGYDYAFDEDFKKQCETRVDSMARNFAPEYWQAWKQTESAMKKNSSHISKRYWEKQKKYYLTLQ